MRRLLYSFLFYMVIGLLSGFYYRELTKAHDFVGRHAIVFSAYTYTYLRHVYVFTLITT